MTDRISRYTKAFRFWWAPLALVLILIGSFGQNALAQPEGGGAIQAIEEGSAAAGKDSTGKPFGQSRNATTASKSTTRSTTRSGVKRPTTTSRKYDGFVIGDKYSFLNFEIAEKVQPVWTRAAQNAHVLGLVQVEVLIETDGSVLTAKARTGNQMLWPEAEKAALATIFNKPEVYGKPARALGFIVYRFGRVEDASEDDGGPPREDPNAPIPEYVTDGKINREAIVLPKLDYQRKPGEGGDTTWVAWVSITVDEKGNVIQAWGDAPYDPVLKSALEKAARGAKFKPRLVRGHAVKVKATLSYDIKPVD